MIKKLLFAAALLMPSLAYGANPTADLSVQIVPAGVPAVPAPAAAAGLTTLARNWDFSQPQYAIQSNWLDCNNNNNSLEWHKGSPGIISTLPCDINQGVDPSNGQTVLVFNFLTSYNVGGGNENFVSMQTINGADGGGFVGFPHAGSYIEVRARLDGTYNNGFNNSSGPDSLYTATTDPSVGGSQLFGNCWYEIDPGELWASAGGFGDGNAHLYPCSQAEIWQSYNGNYNSPGWSVTEYHTYGILMTGNGSGSAFVCLYVDNILQNGCRQMITGGVSPQIQFYPERLIVWAGTYDPAHIAQNKKMYVPFIRVWSCPEWANQMTNHSVAYCAGSQLTSNGALQHWHK